MSTFKPYSIIVTALAFAAILTGCIKNDIPYPRIQPNFTSIEAEYQLQPATIDSLNRELTLYLGEQADIYNVRILSYSISQGGHLVDSTLFQHPINISKPLRVEVELYQQYTWTIKAVQNIAREFAVEGQIGASVIDAPGHRVIATVPTGTNLKQLKVTSIKLGPEGSTMTPDLNGQAADFSKPVQITVTEYGRSYTWTIYIETSEAPVTTSNVIAWANVAWLYGEAEAGKDNGFEYREQGASEWQRVPETWVTQDGGSFTGRLIHLKSETNYEARAYSNDDYGAVIEFTTEGTAQLPNGTMDDWWLDGKVWCPWAEGGTPYWDTGNKGAATLGQSNSVPTDDTSSGTGRAAKLETKFIGIGMLGKLGAGNLFAGVYVKTDGTNGILDFGRPYSMHPTKLRGYMKYHSAPISHANSEFADLKGQPDTCTIWCALIDTNEPFQIRTNPNNRQLFDPKGSYVVAYGALNAGYDIDNYVPFEVELNYVDKARKPKYILVVASASKYGDYFTGGNGSVLYVDDFVLDYDY